MIATPRAMLAGPQIPPGFKTCWPPVDGVWRHPSGAVLVLQHIGIAYALAWRARAHWATWPFDPIVFDSGSGDSNKAEAIAQAEGLFMLGPPPEVISAQETMREKNRIRAKTNYQKAKEKRGPSSYDLNKAVKVSLARIFKLSDSDAMAMGISAAELHPRKKTGRPPIPTQQEKQEAESAQQTRMQQITNQYRPYLEAAGWSGDDIEALAKDAPAVKLRFAQFVVSDDGKKAAAELQAASSPAGSA